MKVVDLVVIGLVCYVTVSTADRKKTSVLLSKNKN